MNGLGGEQVQNLQSAQGLGYNAPIEQVDPVQLEIMKVEQAIQAGQISPEEGQQIVAEIQMQAQAQEQQRQGLGQGSRDGSGPRTSSGGYMSEMAEWAKQQAMT